MTCWVTGDDKTLRSVTVAPRLAMFLNLGVSIVREDSFGVASQVEAEKGPVAYLQRRRPRRATAPQKPRLASSNVSKSVSGLFLWNQFHLHWLIASAIGSIKAALANVEKKATKVLRVMLSGSSGSGRPSYIKSTATMTAHTG
jgi:hypothetical protein